MNIGFENEIFKILDISKDILDEYLFVIYDKHRKNISIWGQLWNEREITCEIIKHKPHTSNQSIKKGKVYYEVD